MLPDFRINMSVWTRRSRTRCTRWAYAILKVVCLVNFPSNCNGNRISAARPSQTVQTSGEEQQREATAGVGRIDKIGQWREGDAVEDVLIFWPCIDARSRVINPNSPKGNQPEKRWTASLRSMQNIVLAQMNLLGSKPLTLALVCLPTTRSL